MCNMGLLVMFMTDQCVQATIHVLPRNISDFAWFREVEILLKKRAYKSNGGGSIRKPDWHARLCGRRQYMIG
jgi:hypothetical protein